MKAKVAGTVILLLLSILAVPCKIPFASASAESNIGWSQTYGSSAEANAIIQASDGGLVLAGGISNGNQGTDFWLVKVDSAGNMQWNKTYGSGIGIVDSASSVVQTSDGGYALLGTTGSSPDIQHGAGLDDFWLVKVDSAGNMQWNKTYGRDNDDWASSVIQTSDGGFAIAGTIDYSWIRLEPNTDVWLVKTDSSGNVEWINTYGGVGNDAASWVVQIDDGGYVIGGQTSSWGSGGDDFWLIKLDSSGSIQWNQAYGYSGDETESSLVKTSDGGYFMVGYTDSLDSESLFSNWVVKADSSGVMQWNKTYEGGEEALSGIQTNDGGYAIAGFEYIGYNSSSGSDNDDGWLVKTDSSGNVQWNKTFGGGRRDWAQALVQTSDGGFALAGFTQSKNSDGYYEDVMWLVKTDATGAIPEFPAGLVLSAMVTIVLPAVLLRRIWLKKRYH